MGPPKTVDAYKIRLDDIECDEEDCEQPPTMVIAYRFDNDEYYHHFWCDEHETVLSPGSILVPEGETLN